MEYLTDEDYRIAEENGIPKLTLYHRWNKLGWDKERAITQPVRINNKYSPYMKMAIKNGIKPVTFYSRINVQGWSPEKAATTPTQKGGKPSKKGITPEIIALAESNGISFKSVQNRVYVFGWTPERAATQPIDQRKIRTDLRRKA